MVIRLFCGVLVFASLLLAIESRPKKWLNDFDQSFYLTIAYDLQHHGTFSNGVFDDVQSTQTKPPPGMFFGPVYPALVYLMAKVDARFAAALACAVEANEGRRDGGECALYVRPIHVVHAAFLASGVVAIGMAAELVVASTAAFYIAGVAASLGLAAEAELFSFIMTESVTVSLASMLFLSLVVAARAGRVGHFAMVGAVLGALCLTRAAYVLLALAIPFMILVLNPGSPAANWQRFRWRAVLAFALGFAVVIAPWVVRNGLAVGKFKLSEEYGSASLVERFAYDRMTAAEGALAFPYCIPEVGRNAVEKLFGPTTMARFDWRTPGGFFDLGRTRRNELKREHGRLDPVIVDLAWAELATHWWRYVLVSIPLAWCGLWIGQWWSLLMVPVFGWACVRALRDRNALFAVYAAPALLILLLHAAVANHYPRYNLGLVGPMAVGFALLANRTLRRHHSAPICGSKSAGTPL